MSVQADMSISKLKWRCRRGMLELDILLSTFVEIEYNSLDKEDIEAFSIVLDYPDQELLDLLLGKSISDDVITSRLVNKIRRATHDDSNLSKVML